MEGLNLDSDTLEKVVSYVGGNDRIYIRLNDELENKFTLYSDCGPKNTDMYLDLVKLFSFTSDKGFEQLGEDSEAIKNIFISVFLEAIKKITDDENNTGNITGKIAEEIINILKEKGINQLELEEKSREDSYGRDFYIKKKKSGININDIIKKLEN